MMIKFIIFSLFFNVNILFADAVILQKPKSYQGFENIKGWYLSEKLDGIRGYWNGKHLLTKNGNKINAPEWFTQNFPPFALDGELWSKRGDFENVQSIVLDKKPSKKWNEITYHIFEVPNQDGNFTQRLKYVREWLDKKSVNHLKIIEQTKCKNRNQLEQFLKKIEKLGGEGVIVKNPKLLYFTGRSSDILKVKKFDDMEGKVIKINLGKGKFQNLMGSLTIRLENGVKFKLGGGFSIYNRKNPPDIGSIVTFKHYGFTKNKKPKFASFLRIRKIE